LKLLSLPHVPILLPPVQFGTYANATAQVAHRSTLLKHLRYNGPKFLIIAHFLPCLYTSQPEPESQP